MPVYGQTAVIESETSIDSGTEDLVFEDGVVSETDAVGREIRRVNTITGEVILEQEYWDNGVLKYSNHQGNENWFDESGALIRTNQTKQNEEVVYSPDGSFSIHAKDENRMYYYDPSGREVRVTDADGTVLRTIEYTPSMRITTAKNGVVERVHLDENGFEYRIEIAPVFRFTIVSVIEKDGNGTISLVNSGGEEQVSAKVTFDKNGEVQFKESALLVRAVLWLSDVFDYNVDI